MSYESAVFQDDGHIYTADGEVVPSVTQVLTLAGISDVSQIPYHNLEKARAIGEAVHQATELIDKDDLDIDTLDPLIAGYILGYQEFKKETNFKPSTIEQRGIGDFEDLRFGYCIDRTGTMDGVDGLVVLDLKTSARSNPNWGIQLAAYDDGAGLSAVRLVVHLKKDGSFGVIAYNDTNDFSVWRSALRVAHWRLAHGAKL
jgi:hypothetical protein